MWKISMSHFQFHEWRSIFFGVVFVLYYISEKTMLHFQIYSLIPPLSLHSPHSPPLPSPPLHSSNLIHTIISPSPSLLIISPSIETPQKNKSALLLPRGPEKENSRGAVVQTRWYQRRGEKGPRRKKQKQKQKTPKNRPSDAGRTNWRRRKKKKKSLRTKRWEKTPMVDPMKWIGVMFGINDPAGRRKRGKVEEEKNIYILPYVMIKLSGVVWKTSLTVENVSVCCVIPIFTSVASVSSLTASVFQKKKKYAVMRS